MRPVGPRHPAGGTPASPGPAGRAAVTRPARPVAGGVLGLALLVTAGTTWLPAPPPGQPADPAPPARVLRDRDVYALVTPSEVVLGNAWVERRWSRAPFRTLSLVDRRTAPRVRARRARPVPWAAPAPEFRLLLAEVPSPGQGGEHAVAWSADRFRATRVDVTRLPRGGLRVVFTLEGPGVEVRREVEAYPRIPGFRSRNVVVSRTALALTGYTLDEVAVRPAAGPVAATIHAFRAGSDWRYRGGGPRLAVGDPHRGPFRETRSAPVDQPLAGPGQWPSLERSDGRRLFMVMERNDFASSRMAFDGLTAAAAVDLSRDVLYTGPLEEGVHVENPLPRPATARARTLLPDRPLALEAVFTGLATDADDEPWQFYRYLTGHRLAPYPKAVVFNTNGVDRNRISTGGKDDVGLAELRRQAAIARRLGIEVFVLDDGWQAASGDWCPDSPACPDPRWDGDPDSPFRPRFPDAEMRAVREALGEMGLGLWMSPLHFHPASRAFRAHPEWACVPAGVATATYNALDPNSGSNEAGIGIWNPLGRGPGGRFVDYLEGVIGRMVEAYGARYLKFDFLTWVDCTNPEPVDLYGYREAFLALVDRLQARYSGVTFQFDETNDYRLFPFEAIARGPTWFQNGSPTSRQLLHNVWNLAPYIPPFAIGQPALARRDERERLGVDFLMAVALPSHLTLWDDLTSLSEAEIRAVRRWLDFYKAYRDELAGFTYPLLEDPISGGWTALQPWDPDAGRGFLLVYRLDDPRPWRRVPLRGVPPGRRFDLYRMPDGTHLGTVTSQDLVAGLPVYIPRPFQAEVIRIVPRAGEVSPP